MVVDDSPLSDLFFPYLKSPRKLEMSHFHIVSYTSNSVGNSRGGGGVAGENFNE